MKRRLCVVLGIVLSVLSMVSAPPVGFRDYEVDVIKYDYSVKPENNKLDRAVDFTNLELVKVGKVWSYCFIELKKNNRLIALPGIHLIYTASNFIGDFSTQHVDVHENKFYHIDIENLKYKFEDKNTLEEGLSLQVFSTIKHRAHCRKALLGARSLKNRARRQNLKYSAEFKHERGKYSTPKRHIIKV